MVLELAGTRIISPFYGGSLYVWASLISVTLLSLAAGYFLGGIIADKHPRLPLLMLMLLIPGLFTLILPLVTPPVLKFSNALGIRLGTLAASFLLFSIPLCCLGMVAPFSVKLITRKLQHLGISTGRLYAISTAGSFSGSLLTGFILIPLMGIRNIFFLAGSLLLAISLCGYLFSRKFLFTGAVCVLAAGLIFSNVYLINITRVRVTRVVSRQQNPYGTIVVADEGDDRYLLVNTSVQSYINKSDFVSRAEYVHCLAALPFYRPGSQTALLVGLGAGCLPMLLDFFGITTDVIEIDPVIVETAEKYFNFKSTGKILVEDGRYIINNLQQQQYDLVIIDAFLGGTMAYQLCSLEVFQKIETVLPVDGILAINTIDFADKEEAGVLAAILRTLEEVFSSIHIYTNGESPGMGNFIIFASNIPLSILTFQPDAEYPHPLTKYYLKSLPFLKKDYTGESGILLTDDYNPLESMDSRQADNNRNATIDYFGEDLFTFL